MCVFMCKDAPWYLKLSALRKGLVLLSESTLFQPGPFSQFSWPKPQSVQQKDKIKGANLWLPNQVTDGHGNRLWPNRESKSASPALHTRDKSCASGLLPSTSTEL